MRWIDERLAVRVKNEILTEALISGCSDILPNSSNKRDFQVTNLKRRKDKSFVVVVGRVVNQEGSFRHGGVAFCTAIDLSVELGRLAWGDHRL